MNKYYTMLALAAASAAYRVQNNRYVKNGEVKYDEKTQQRTMLTSNRQLTVEFLNNPNTILPQDYEFAESIRDEYQKITFKLLSGKRVSDIDYQSLKLIENEMVDSRDIGLVSYLPQGYSSMVEHRRVEDIISEASMITIGKMDERITSKATVIRCFWSSKWAVYFITATLDTGGVVSFAYRQELSVNKNIEVRGTIKGYRENVAQLSRPKVNVL